jgi:amino acid transporter
LPRTTSKLRLFPLIGATYFMVSGGPYGLEDIIGKAGYTRALLLLLFIPFVWSVPTSLMVGELASAIPEEGGYYRWVRRALGPFWGFQEAWLSLTASVFDMAIYPVTFVLYLGRVAPTWTEGYRGTLWALTVVLACAAWNLYGAKAVGEGSIGLFCLLLAPFAVLVAIALWRALTHHPVAVPVGAAEIMQRDLPGAISVALWNYMGWDNASTVAQEVDRPQRNYPRAMLASAALVAVTYILPLVAVASAGIPAARFSTGAWTDAATVIAGSMFGASLGLAVVLGGAISGFGMFNALTLSYTRVPYALAQEGLLPRALTRTTRRGVPWLSVLLCSAAWAMALRFSFERLISIDLVLYGAALLLEFVALVALRLREPALDRPFRVPGGLAGAIASGIGPAALIAFAIYAARHEQVAGLPAPVFAALVAITGPLLYLTARKSRRQQ